MSGLYSKLSQCVLIAGLYALILLLQYIPFLEGKTLYQADIFIYFEPVWRFLRDSLSQNHLPLWNPFALCGMPQTAICSPSLLYPFNLAFLLLPFGPALATTIYFHQWLMAVLTYLYLRELQLSKLAAFTGGAIAAMNGYVLGSSQCYTLMAAFAWTPLGLLSIERSTVKPAWLVLLSLVFALQIYAGRPEIYLSAALIYLGVAVNKGKTQLQWRSRNRELRTAELVVPFLLLGGNIGAASTLPLLELYRESPRLQGLHYEEIVRWSAGWYDWMQVVLVTPFGNLITGNYHLNPETPGLYPYVSSLFVGPVALSLAVIGFFFMGRQKLWFWLSCLVVFVLLASGSHGGLVPLWYQLAPSTLVFRYPIKLAIFPLFILAVAAAYGLDALQKEQVKLRLLYAIGGIWLLCWLLGTSVLCAFFIQAPLAQAVWGSATIPGGTNAIQDAATALESAGFLGAFAMIAFVPGLLKLDGGIKPDEMCRVMCLMVIATLVWGQSRLLPVTETSFFGQSSPLSSWIEEQKQKSSKGQNQERVLVLLPENMLSPKSYWRPRNLDEHSVLLSTFERQVLEPDSNIDFGLEETYGFSPTETSAQRLLFLGVTTRSSLYAQSKDGSQADGQRQGSADSGAASGSAPANRYTASDIPLWRYCQITNTGYVVTLNNRPQPAPGAQFHQQQQQSKAAASPAAAWEPTIEEQPRLSEDMFHLVKEFPEQDARIYEVDKKQPRATFHSHWQYAADQVSAMKQVFFADQTKFDPAQSAIITSASNGADEPPPASGNKSENNADTNPNWGGDSLPITLSELDPEHISLQFKAPSKGYVVLSVLNYPGWRVFENKQRLKLRQANGLFQAVLVEPGEHQLNFQYSPVSFFAGLLIEVLSLAALLVAFLLLRQQPLH